MFSAKHYINIISLTILSLITLINVYRVTLNFSSQPLLISLIYILLFLGLIFLIDKKSIKNFKSLRNYFPIILSVYVLFPYLVITYFISKSGSPQRWIETEILIYILLLALLILLANKFIDYKKFNLTFFLFAFLLGIILSANFYIVFVLMLTVLFIFRNSTPKLFIFSAIVLAIGFLLPIFFESFNFTFNYKFFFPIISNVFLIFLLVACLYVGWITADLQELFFASGIILFIYLIFPITSKIFEIGFYNFTKNDMLATSLITVVPFLLFSIKEYEVDKFLGKVYK